MDSLLKPLKVIKEILDFKGHVQDMTRIDNFHVLCKKHKFIPSNLKASMIPADNRDAMTDLLVELTHKFVLENNIDSWDEFARNPKTRKIAKLLFEFGVRGEVFPLEEEGQIKKEVEEDRRLTFQEFYELYQIKFNFDGPFGSFKKVIEKNYGSFAEYCLLKGYDINNTKWESDETAIRIAQKIGSMEKVKSKSSSLYNYLNEKNLLEMAFGRKAS